MVPTSVGLSTEFTPAGIINATALFRADGSLARVEVYIKVCIILIKLWLTV